MRNILIMFNFIILQGEKLVFALSFLKCAIFIDLMLIFKQIELSY